jgi:hypothetical protein
MNISTVESMNSENGRCILKTDGVYHSLLGPHIVDDNVPPENESRNEQKAARRMN